MTSRNGTAEQKSELRKLIAGRIIGLSPDDMAFKSAVACSKVCSLEEFIAAKLILCYRAMPRECDPASVAAAAIASGKRVAYPRCMAKRELQLLVPQDDSAFTVGSYGISEPDPDRSAEVSIADIDFALIPGVAFDPSCSRMGHGAGYYDRLLEGSSATLAAMAFDEQIVERVPCDAHDISMDYVITDKWIYCK